MVIRLTQQQAGGAWEGVCANSLLLLGERLNEEMTCT